jgi:acyl carrier protein
MALIDDTTLLNGASVSGGVLKLVRQFAPGLPASDTEALAASLPAAGLTSMAAVKLMLALEAEFGIAIPDADLTPENFATLESLGAMVVRLRGD